MAYNAITTPPCARSMIRVLRPVTPAGKAPPTTGQLWPRGGKGQA